MDRKLVVRLRDLFNWAHSIINTDVVLSHSFVYGANQRRVKESGEAAGCAGHPRTGQR